MSHKSMSATIRCDDNAEMLVFNRIVWTENDELLAFSIMDSYIGKKQYQGLWGRFRRAWHVLFAKPICYTEIVTTEKERVGDFLNECLAILNSDAGGRRNDENHSLEQTKQACSERIPYQTEGILEWDISCNARCAERESL